jgi:hypothetical protein
MTSDTHATSDELREKLERTQDEKDDLQDQLTDALTQLAQYRSDSWQITDSDVARRYERVCSAIHRWVTSIETDYLRRGRSFRQVMNDIMRHESERELLYNIGLRRRFTSEGDKSSWSAANWEFGKLAWLAEQETCILVIMNKMVWHRLYAMIFDAPYPIGVAEDAERGLDWIGEAFKGGRDGQVTNGMSVRFIKYRHADIHVETFATSGRWISDTIARLLETTRYRAETERRQTGMLKKFNDELFDRPFELHRDSLHHHISNLRDDVIWPAIQLKEALSKSTSKFVFNEPIDLFDASAGTDDRIHDVVLRDAATWRAPNEAIGGYLAYLFPGIYRQTPGREDFEVAKPVVLTISASVVAARRFAVYRPENMGQTKNSRRKSFHGTPPPRSATSKSLDETSHKSPRHSNTTESRLLTRKLPRGPRSWFGGRKEDDRSATPHPSSTAGPPKTEDSHPDDRRGRNKRRDTESSDQSSRQASRHPHKSHKASDDYENARSYIDSRQTQALSRSQQNKRDEPIDQSDITPRSTIKYLASAHSTTEPLAVHEGDSEVQSTESEETTDNDQANFVSIEPDGQTPVRIRVSNLPRTRGIEPTMGSLDYDVVSSATN